MVRTRLQRHVRNRASCPGTCLLERYRLGMRLARTRVMTLADDLAIMNDHTAHHRIGRGESCSESRKLIRPAHERVGDQL